MSNTTIQVDSEVKDLLKARKENSNESHNDVLRRELGLAVDEEVADLTAYLSPEATNEVETIIEILRDEFDLEESYDEAGDSGYPTLQFQHPDSDMPIVNIEASANTGSYTSNVRMPNEKWKTWMRSSYERDPDDEKSTSKLHRFVNGAVQKFG